MQLEETHAKDLSKAQETRETSIQVAYNLKTKNDELVESHTTLFENFEQLRETHKVTQVSSLSSKKHMLNCKLNSYMLALLLLIMIRMQMLVLLILYVLKHLLWRRTLG